MLRLSILFLALGLLLMGNSSAAQIDELRDGLRESLQRVKFASVFGSLVLVSDEFELSTATYEFEDEAGTELQSIAFPFHKSYRPWGDNAPGLYFEGVLGYAKADQDVEDIYGGALPGFETGADTSWTTYGGLIGVGLEYDLNSELTLTPILNLGLAGIENDTDYSGPGAAFSAALADGLAFNWSGITLSHGISTRLDWNRRLGEHHTLEFLGRYDLRWTESLQADDPAQEFTTRAQVLTLRTDVTGPIGQFGIEQDLGWGAFLGYRRFVEGHLFGAQDFLELGGSLELDLDRHFGVNSLVSLNFAIIHGDGFKGTSLGMGLSF